METVDWGGSFFRREDSQVACLVEVLRCAGQQVTYAEVMGLSACAFKLTMARRWPPHKIHSEFGLDWPEIMGRVFGLEYAQRALVLEDVPEEEWGPRLLELAREAVTAGLPLLYMNGEWNLLVGYLDDGSAFVCKPYAGGPGGYEEMFRPGGFVGEAWFVSRFARRGAPAARRQSVVWSLRKAVELAHTPASDDGDEASGFTAYEDWIAGLEVAREDVSLHGNAFSYSQLLTSRDAAAAYLHGIADELGPGAQPHLREAAERYADVAARLWEGRSCVEHPWDVSWTPENRSLQAELMRQSLADERLAVAGLEATLEILEAG